MKQHSDYSPHLDYKALFKKMLNGFAFHKINFDKDGNPTDYEFLEINEAFEKILGIKREEVIGKRVSEVLPSIKGDTVDWIEKYAKVAQEGSDITFTAYSETLKRWFKIYAFSPKQDYFATIVEDVTEQREKYRLNIVYKKLLDRTGDMVGILSVGLKPKYIFANQAHKENLGYEPEFLLGKSPVEFVHKDDWFMILQLIKKNVMRTGRKILQRKEYIKPEKLRFRFKAASGKYKVLESTADMIDNKIFVVSRDVTEQVTYLKMLEQEKERAETYFNIAGNVLLVLDRHGTVTKINKSGCELLQAEQNEIVGTNWFKNYIPKEAEQEVKTIFTNILSNDNSVEYFENEVVTAKGVRKTVWWHNNLLKDEKGEVIGTLSSGEDVTDKRENESKIKKRNTELERFNKLTVGREMKMIELKNEVDRLKEKLKEKNKKEDA